MKHYLPVHIHLLPNKECLPASKHKTEQLIVIYVLNNGVLIYLDVRKYYFFFRS